MARTSFQAIEDKKDSFFPFPQLSFQLNPQETCFPPGGLFASAGQMGVGFGISPNSGGSSRDTNAGGKIPGNDLYLKYMESGYRIVGIPTTTEEAAEELKLKEKKGGGIKFKIKVRNPSLRRLLSGAIAGAISRTAVAPLETIRTHLMVGSSGHSTTEVFRSIMNTDGWPGLFRGNFVNVIRVAPSKAIEEFPLVEFVSVYLLVVGIFYSVRVFDDPRLQPSTGFLPLAVAKGAIQLHILLTEFKGLHSRSLFAYDTVKKNLSPNPGEQPKIPIPASLVAGACAGVSSTLCTYPLELVKTRLTIQRGVYSNLLHAFMKILKEEGPAELYRGLTPSLIGVVPYAATNYFAYDMLRKAYRKTFNQEEIGNIATLLIGSAAGAISSSATFPLEVARKHMQVGALSGRQVYRDVFHALTSILEQEGLAGLYKGLGPSCMKLVPAAGISFMCYEACKKILIEKENEA